MIYSVDEIKERIQPIAKNYGVNRVFLFGSYARGDASLESDIDLRIDCGMIPDLYDLAGFHMDLEDVFSKRVEVLTTEGLEKNFLLRIKDEELLLYEYSGY